jgi:hypothetical protein
MSACKYVPQIFVSRISEYEEKRKQRRLGEIGRSTIKPMEGKEERERWRGEGGEGKMEGEAPKKMAECNNNVDWIGQMPTDHGEEVPTDHGRGTPKEGKPKEEGKEGDEVQWADYGYG